MSKEHGQAILAWLVNGCLGWAQHGLGEPPVITETTQHYRESQDILVDTHGLARGYLRKGVARVKSGIYARFGTENKDLVTEATAQEFRDWLAVKGLNISFISDETLNGLFLERKRPFLQWEIRLAFILDAEANGITVSKKKDEWEAFKVAFQEEADRYYG